MKTGLYLDMVFVCVLVGAFCEANGHVFFGTVLQGMTVFFSALAIISEIEKKRGE